MTSATSDGDPAAGDADAESVDAAVWEEVARNAVFLELHDARADIHESVYDLAEALRAGESIDADAVVEVRKALNRQRRVLENQVAPIAAGAEPWGRPVPDMPMGRIYEVYHIPRPGEDDE